MIKKITVLLCFLYSLFTFAQESTASPYSIYGIGDIKLKGTVENRSMGGVSVFSDSIHLNIQNPAQLTSLKLTSFAIGGTTSFSTLKTDNQKEKAKRTSFDYLAIGIPAGKLSLGLGIMPFSSVGYNIQKAATSSDPTISSYQGDGGTNKVFFGFGYKLTKNFNFGADVQYNFGNIETTSLILTDQIQYGTKETNKSELEGFNVDLGLTFQSKLNNKLTLFSSLTYTPEASLKLSNTRNISIVQPTLSGGYLVVDSQDQTVKDNTILLPTKYSFGIGVGEEKKWTLGSEITYSQNSVFSNRFTDIVNSTYENSIRYSVGGYYIPNYNSYSNYFKRIVYRGGFRYENTGLIINNNSINDLAFSAGLGLPLGGAFSNLNFNFEFGKKGTTSNNLVEENYFNLSIGLSLSDKWFVKRKYN